MTNHRPGRLAALLLVMLLALFALPPAPAAAAVPAPTQVELLADHDGAQDYAIALPAAATVSSAEAPWSVPSGPEIPAPLGFAPALIGMTALAKDRLTPRKDGRLIGYPVAANKKVYAGSLVVLNAGYAEGGTTALNLVAVGRANEQVDNTGGAAGALTVLVERGVFLFAQEGSITQADVGKTAYIVDDQTVADNNGANTRSAAGIIRGVEAGGVWVEI